MAVQKLTYSAKRSGDIWSSGEVNEIKQVVNNNADELTAIQAAIVAIDTNRQTPVTAQTQTTVTILPNVLNKWESGVAALNITLGTGTAGVVNEYMMEFTVAVTGSAVFALTLPSSVRWLEEPEWENGTTYQVSIVNNLAIAAAWAS